MKEVEELVNKIYPKSDGKFTKKLNSKLVNDINKIIESKLKAVEESDYNLVRGYISWSNKKWNTPNPNPQLYDLEVKSYLRERTKKAIVWN